MAEKSNKKLPAVQQQQQQIIEELPKGQQQQQQDTKRTPKKRMVKYTDILSQSELDELLRPVDDFDDEWDEEISVAQHEINCQEWDHLVKYIKIPHYYIELIMESNGVQLPENFRRLDFPIRSFAPETVAIMKEALLLEAAFRQGLKHSTEWTLDTDVAELEAALRKARITPLTDTLSLMTKSGCYPRLEDISPPKIFASPSKRYQKDVPCDPPESSQNKRQRLIEKACQKQALLQRQEQKSLKEQRKSKDFKDTKSSFDSQYSSYNSWSCSGSKSRVALSPSAAERVQHEMRLRVKQIDEALKRSPKSKAQAGHRSRGSSPGSRSGSDSDSSSGSSYRSSSASSSRSSSSGSSSGSSYYSSSESDNENETLPKSAMQKL
ncbi:uncharacterized protein LOC111066148 [Drosophila obscura]|uniref:uncharacterized protein LOC111066148 n=1 Tax=Drosophila obscura TaxID=7282 RepID=UPI001BB17702|nr:uncharacterized protein LOC111066148 [Drosophila obscura]